MNNRRHFLRSSTALIALPFLDSLGFRRFASARTPPAPPKRLVFLGFGWGVTDESWCLTGTHRGETTSCRDGLKPLEAHKADFSIVQGLWNQFSVEGHAGSTWWLSGANKFGQAGQSMHNSISADQGRSRATGDAHAVFLTAAQLRRDRLKQRSWPRFVDGLGSKWQTGGGPE